MRSCNLASCSPGKLAARTSTVLNALASWITAALARSLSLQTCAAVNATNRPKSTPSGDSMPAETALNDLPCPFLASAAMPAWIASASIKVKPKTSSAIHGTGSSWNQSLIVHPFRGLSQHLDTLPAVSGSEGAQKQTCCVPARALRPADAHRQADCRNN